MAGQRFSHELSDLPAQMAAAGFIPPRRLGYGMRKLSHVCLKCGRHEADAMNLCAECGGSGSEWRHYRPDVAGDPPFYGSNWVPLDQITLRKVGH